MMKVHILNAIFEERFHKISMDVYMVGTFVIDKVKCALL